MSEFTHVESFDFGVHQELAHSHDYINRIVYPDHRLYTLLLHWNLEKENPDRSERSRQEVSILCGRLAFELLSREKEQIREEDGAL